MSSFLSFDNLRQISDAFVRINDCLNDNTGFHRHENKLYHETMLRCYPEAYGPFLNAVEANRTSPQKAELMRKQYKELEDLKQKLNQELEQQKKITQAMYQNPNNQVPQTNQNILAIQQKLDEITRLQSNQTPLVTNNKQVFNNQNNSNQTPKTKDFWDKMNQLY